MAKAATPIVTRAPVLARGLELLAFIAAAPEGKLMLTADEGKDAVDAGFAVVNGAVVDGDAAEVSLTAQGIEALKPVEEPAAEAVAVAKSAGYVVDDGVPIPNGGSKSRKGREETYPFTLLEVNQSFHVPKSVANPDPATRLASSVTGARARFAEPTGEMETVTVKSYQRGEDGKSYAKTAEDKRIVTGETSVERPKMKLVRDFIVRTVDATDPKGEGARVWRTK